MAYIPSLCFPIVNTHINHVFIFHGSMIPVLYDERLIGVGPIEFLISGSLLHLLVDATFQISCLKQLISILELYLIALVIHYFVRDFDLLLYFFLSKSSI